MEPRELHAVLHEVLKETVQTPSEGRMLHNTQVRTHSKTSPPQTRSNCERHPRKCIQNQLSPGMLAVLVELLLSSLLLVCLVRFGHTGATWGLLECTHACNDSFCRLRQGLLQCFCQSGVMHSKSLLMLSVQKPCIVHGLAACDCIPL
eukprot:6487461-Amphidinium_carterae.3